METWSFRMSNRISSMYFLPTSFGSTPWEEGRRREERGGEREKGRGRREEEEREREEGRGRKGEGGGEGRGQRGKQHHTK